MSDKTKEQKQDKKTEAKQEEQDTNKKDKKQEEQEEKQAAKEEKNISSALAQETDSSGEEKKEKSSLVELPDSIKARLEKRQAVSAREKKARKRKKKKKDRKVPVGKAYIKSTYNNTIVTLTDLNGNVLAWASAGVAGFKGPKKATPYAAQIITRIASQKAQKEYGLKEISVFVKGVGTGREAAIRALNANGFMITSIKDITPIPHNGCRPPRPRRV